MAESTAIGWTSLASKSLPAPHFAYSPIVMAGNFIHVSGMVGLDPDHGRLVAGGLDEETLQILNNLRGLCEELGVSLANNARANLLCRLRAI